MQFSCFFSIMLLNVWHGNQKPGKVENNMCGIAAISNLQNVGTKARDELKIMLQSMQHRGRDGTYVYASPKVAIGMNRLAIVGGDSGAQPIWNEDRTIAVVCNGEIYNYRSLREQLEQSGHVFQSTSDVEVIVHLYEEFEEKCVERLIGTFAFVVWDEANNRLLIARDRIGVKPLYYAQTPNGFAFASELSAILSIAPGQLNKDMIYTYHTLRFLPAPHTAMEGIYKLPAGHYAIVQHLSLMVQPYWHLNQVIARGKLENREWEESDKVLLLNRLVRNAIASQQSSEVQSATLLSGGLDSTLLVSLQKKLYGDAPETITVSFEPPTDRSGTSVEEYDERFYARKVADYYACRHMEEQFSACQVWEALPKIIKDLDEPIADPTAIPLWFASKLASVNGHKVLYSGEGIDELFAGYDLYRQWYWLRTLQHIPEGIRQFVYRFLVDHDVPGSGVIYRSFAPIKEWYQSVGSLFNQHELEQLLFDLENQYPHAVSSPHQGNSRWGMYWEAPIFSENLDTLSSMLYFDFLHWLPENTLAKSDKISMAHTIELRVPFLDEALVEFALPLPLKDKMRFGTHKYLIKKAFREEVPSFVIHRKKAGFPVPINAWIFGEWNTEIKNMLLDPSSYTRSLYRPEMVNQLLESKGVFRPRASRLIWSLITMELWMQQSLVLENNPCINDGKIKKLV